MSLRNPNSLVHVGMLALPLAGMLALVGLYGTSQLGSGGRLATGDNRVIVSTGYFVSVLFGNVLALTVLIFGVMALYAYLANTRQRALALAGMVLSTVGIALILSRSGITAYAVPALSRSFLDGNPESIEILDSIFAGPLATVESLTASFYSAGFVLFGVAVWRSGKLPGWAGILMAVHAPLISGPFLFIGSVAGALLAFAGGGWIAISVLRDSTARADPEAAPHR